MVPDGIDPLVFVVMLEDRASHRSVPQNVITDSHAFGIFCSLVVISSVWRVAMNRCGTPAIAVTSGSGAVLAK